MVTESLTNICLEKLATSICHAPPLIKDMIIEKSLTKIRKEKKERIKQQVISQVCCTLVNMIPEMISDIVDTTYSVGMDSVDRRIIIGKYSNKNIDEYIVDTALDIAETIAIFYNFRKNTIRDLNYDELSYYGSGYDDSSLDSGSDY